MRENRRVMAAGKEQEANGDQNEREEQEELVQSFLLVLG